MQSKRLSGLSALLILAACGGMPGGLTATGSPSGDTSGELALTVGFDHPMVAADAIGKPVDKPPVRITPAIAGVWRWTDEKTLSFQPSAPLPKATPYKVEVFKGTRALGGKGLADPYRFEFATERLSLQIEELGTRAIPKQEVVLRFNLAVEPALVTQHCRFASGKSSVPAVLAGQVNVDADQGRVFRLLPAEPLALDADWAVKCGPALRGLDGPLGLSAEKTEDFHTYGPLHALSLEPAGKDVPAELNVIAVRFSNQLEPPYTMEISPRVEGFPEWCNTTLEDEAALLRCSVSIEADTAYTVKVKAGQKDRFGQTLSEEKTFTFQTTNALPTLSMETGMYTAERSRMVYPLWTRNVDKLQVDIAPVSETALPKVMNQLNWWDNEALNFKEAGLKAHKKEIAVKHTRNEWTQVALDPAKLLPGPPAGIYYFGVTSKDVGEESRRYSEALINFTDLGITTKMAAARGMVWVTRLSTGKPVAGADVYVRGRDGKERWRGVTDADGLAITPGRVDLRVKRTSEEQDEEENYAGASELVFVKHEGDISFVDPNNQGSLSAYNFNVSSEYHPAKEHLRGFLHTDRGIYRPGESVHLKGLARVMALGSGLRTPGKADVAVTVSDPRGRTVFEDKVPLSRFGGFWFDVELPDDARLGDYSVHAELPQGSFRQYFSVEEFRVATFEVDAKSVGAELVGGGKLVAKVAANYFYGAPVRAGNVTWTVHRRPREVSFDKFENYTFFDERVYDSYYGRDNDSEELVTETTGTLDASGNHEMELELSPNQLDSDVDLLFRVKVSDESNQTISDQFAVPYFRTQKYAGIALGDWFVAKNSKQTVKVVVVDPSGQAVAGTVVAKIERRDFDCIYESWGYRGSHRCEEKIVPILSKTLNVTAGKAIEVPFEPSAGGEYYISVDALEGGEIVAPSARRIWVYGGGGAWQENDGFTFDLIPDAKEYKPGDTARVMLKTSLSQATGLLTIERDGVLEHRLFEITADNKTIDIPITEAFAPNVYAAVALVQGRTGPGVRGKPMFRMGLVNLPVKVGDTTLTVTVKTDRPDYRPGDDVTATVDIKDRAGKPVEAELSLVAADEGVLSLVGFETPNPTPVFYAPYALGVASATLYERLTEIPGPEATRPTTGGDSAGALGSLRSRFLSTAVWLPGIVTDKEGHATATFKAPDNLTAFRVMAVAADEGARFGSADVRFKVNKKLLLHSALPRFLTVGDVAQAGVIAHNETGKDGTVKVKARYKGGASIDGKDEVSVLVKAGARVPVRFPIRGASPGEATLSFEAQLGDERDGVEFSLPVELPGQAEYVVVASGKTSQPLDIPWNAPAGTLLTHSSLQVSVDPHGVAGIERGLEALIEYPYGCLEQTTSRVIPMVALKGLIQSLGLNGLDRAALDKYVKAGIAKIGRHQKENGGFSLWPGGEAEVYYTAYGLWGLQLARKAGYAVDENRMEDAARFLEMAFDRPPEASGYHDLHGELGDQAFALYVHAQVTKSDPQRILKLVAERNLPVYGRAYLALALAQTLGKNDATVQLMAAELEQAVGADGSVGEPKQALLWWYMSDDARTTAIVLNALLELKPGSEKLAAIVHKVAENQRGTLSTQSALYSLLALNRYVETRASKKAQVKVTDDGEPLLSGAIGGSTPVRAAGKKLRGPSGSVRIEPKGEIFYTVAMRIRKDADHQPASARGLTVTRRFLSADGKEEVSAFKVGDVVRVEVKAHGKKEQPHLALSDYLPSGFEIINTRLKTEAMPDDPAQQYYWRSFQELRDERADFFADIVWDGELSGAYLVRATTPGRFVVPPARAEAMYQPELSGTTALQTIEIADK